MGLVERRLAWPGLGLGGIRHRATAVAAAAGIARLPRAVLAAHNELTVDYRGRDHYGGRV